jgi:DNA repair protein RadA/Sms
MTSKIKTSFVCTECGESFSRWQGKCTNCGAWSTLQEFREAKQPKRSSSLIPAQKSEIVALSSIEPRVISRTSSLFPEVDRVLGGGLVGGAVILLGGDPGIGKSTLLLQLLSHWSRRGKKGLYVTGEESSEQTVLRGQRLGIKESTALILAETSIDTILSHIAAVNPDVVVIDSIQAVFSEQLQSSPGSVSQLRECAAMLVQYAKKHNTVILLIGHVTKEGTIAGPRLLEHMVDTVLAFEGDSHYQYRILRSIKNRFGPSGELALFTMSDSGLSEVTNPSEFFLLSRAEPQIGSSVAPIAEGTRILVVELQALVNQTHFGLPQRVASGINPKKLALLLAVLERHGGFSLGDYDIFFNIAGGLTVGEPAIDCGICAAILSSFRNKPVRKNLACIGECGLGGELRPVNRMIERIKECGRMGFTQCVVPKPGKRTDWTKAVEGVELLMCNKVAELQYLIF